jgi:hypothetical protein
VAGFFLAQTGKMPKVGDSYHSDDGYDMIVTSMEGRRIKTLCIHKRKPGAAETDKIVRSEQRAKQKQQKQDQHDQDQHESRAHQSGQQGHQHQQGQSSRRTGK